VRARRVCAHAPCLILLQARPRPLSFHHRRGSLQAFPARPYLCLLRRTGEPFSQKVPYTRLTLAKQSLEQRRSRHCPPSRGLGQWSRVKGIALTPEKRMYQLDSFTRFIRGLVSSGLYGVPVQCKSTEYLIFHKSQATLFGAQELSADCSSFPEWADVLLVGWCLRRSHRRIPRQP
jgi:hypothetical protein